MRTLVALLGLAAFLALFAGIHYSSDRVTFEEESLPAFVMAPGEVRSTAFQPTLPDTVVHIHLDIQGGPIDAYVMPSEQAARLPMGGSLRLDAPFSYDARWSRTNVSDTTEIRIVSDGRTWHDLILDNSDNHYDGDAQPTGTATVHLTARYIAVEERSLVLAYFAVLPSILLVTLTVVRKLRRLRRGGRRPSSPASP